MVEYGERWCTGRRVVAREFKTTFDVLCRELSSHIKRQDRSFRKFFAVKAITVWRLATNMEYRNFGSIIWNWEVKSWRNIS